MSYVRGGSSASVTNLQPGHGYVVNATLQYRGSRAPVAVPYGAPSAVAWGVALLFVIAIAVLIFGFVTREQARGRFVWSMPRTPSRHPSAHAASIHGPGGSEALP